MKTNSMKKGENQPKQSGANKVNGSLVTKSPILGEQ
jgi:hypothetical protein